MWVGREWAPGRDAVAQGRIWRRARALRTLLPLLRALAVGVAVGDGQAKGVALALSATVIGLAIAIPSLVGSGYLQRKIENYAAQLDVLLERILRRTRQ